MKNRVRMIVVLVCVFVVLPVVGGLVYSFSVSAEAAARYYAEAIARACLIVCVSVFCLKGLMHDE